MSKLKENTGQMTTLAEKDRKFREALWYLVEQSGRSERQICQQLGHKTGISISCLTAMQIRHTRGSWNWLSISTWR